MQQTTDFIVHMQGIHKWFPGVKALDEVTFTCGRGEIRALVGENGAGKSTLIKILGGVYQADAGTVAIDGRETSFRSPNEAQRAGVSIIHQEHTLVPYMTVAENIMLGDESTGRFGLVNAAVLRSRAAEALSEIGCEIKTSEIVANLNSTQQKLVEIAKALALKPRILVVDEPTASLGTREVALFFAALRRLRERGTAIVYISHLLDEVFQIADQVSVLKDGRNVKTLRVDQTSADEIIRLMIGRELGDLFPARSTSVSERVILEVSGCNRGNALRAIDLKLRAGEILGIAGLEGNGQNALLRTIFGAFDKDSGRIVVDGKTVSIRKPADAIRAGITLVTDNRAAEGLCLQLDVAQNLALPTLKLRQRLGVVNRRRERKMVDRSINDLKIKTSSASTEVKFLSGGNQQKTVVGKWLNVEPRILFFLEPTLGIDVGAKAEIYQLLRRLVEEQGKGIIVVTSDMLELLGLCDRVLVMYQGRIVKELQGEAVTEEAIMQAAVGR
jgi:ribose transport system ATP-binding protein